MRMPMGTFMMPLLHPDEINEGYTSRGACRGKRSYGKRCGLALLIDEAILLTNWLEIDVGLNGRRQGSHSGRAWTPTAAMLGVFGRRIAIASYHAIKLE